MGDSTCGGSTTCYCCCGDGDDGGIDTYNSCVKFCEKQNDGMVCDDSIDGDFISSSEVDYIKKHLGGECDGARPRARAAAAALFSALLWAAALR